MKRSDLKKLIRECIQEIQIAKKVIRPDVLERPLFQFTVRLGNVVDSEYVPDVTMDIAGNSVEDFIDTLKAEIALQSAKTKKQFQLSKEAEQQLRSQLTKLYVDYIGNKNE